MSSKIWRATGEYGKKRRRFRFMKEMIAMKEAHVRERLYSEIGSRHRVKRKDITIEEVVEIQPEELRDLDLRRILGVESEL
ncbi:MAG: 50S ribosomal protein L18a [Candidatus Thorarchaeota archaeon]|nr:50S ribosomal protein L18a [Candidatus Thorarchaeota archaeon]